MALSGIFGSSSNLRKITNFEIRPDNDYILYRGPHNETPTYTLEGRVLLSLGESLQTKGIELVLEGKRRTEYHQNPYAPEFKTGPRVYAPIKTKGTLFTRMVRLQHDDREIRVLKPGDYEFPFGIDLPGNAEQSIEGMDKNWLVYELKAVVDRGKFAKDLTTVKHLRVVRTLGADPDEFGDPQVVEGMWPDKLKYTFGTTSRSFIFGDQVITDVCLTPLIAKLTIDRIHVTLKENRKIKTIPGPEYNVQTQQFVGRWKDNQEVSTKSFKIPADSETTNQELDLPMYKFKLTFPLPKTLTKCRQSVEEGEWINIKHVMEYRVVLLNSDGHYSELKAHHSVKLFISPNLPVGRDHSVSLAHTGDSNQLEDLRAAPPDYGTHRLDRLYADVDPSGYMTPLDTEPGPSGMGRGLGGITNSMQAEPSSTSYVPPPEELEERLRRVQEHEEGQQDGLADLRRPGRPIPARSAPGETPMSGHETQEFMQYDMEALSKMPSYQTALRTPLSTSLGDVPPAYEEATSRPESPSLTRQTTALKKIPSAGEGA